MLYFLFISNAIIAIGIAKTIIPSPERIISMILFKKFLYIQATLPTKFLYFMPFLSNKHAKKDLINLATLPIYKTPITTPKTPIQYNTTSTAISLRLQK